MKHFGDITKIKGSDVPLVDIVCGGSPCQDLSIAGNRAGLSGERSGLFMEQIRIIKEMRNESTRQLSMRGSDVDFRLVSPRYMVWENVQGAFSSPGIKDGEDRRGEDFRVVLEEIAKVRKPDAIIPRPPFGKWTKSGCIMGDGWSIAWRLHDAQFWGVPQRRKESRLSQILEGRAHQRYYLSARACLGIMSRAKNRGKELPELLRMALIKQSMSCKKTGLTEPNEADATEKDGEKMNVTL